MKRKLIALSLVVALGAAVVSPLASSRVSAAPAPSAAAATVHAPAHFFDKTRFVLHVGAAFFLFHHFIWAKYKAGDFKKGAPHFKSNVVKAAIALALTVHELHVAYNIAKGSHSKTLQALIKPVNAVIGKFNSAWNAAKSGALTNGMVGGLNGVASSFASAASKAGASIKDVHVPCPGC